MSDHSPAPFPTAPHQSSAAFGAGDLAIVSEAFTWSWRAYGRNWHKFLGILVAPFAFLVMCGIASFVRWAFVADELVSGRDHGLAADIPVLPVWLLVLLGVDVFLTWLLLPLISRIALGAAQGQAPARSAARYASALLVTAVAGAATWAGAYFGVVPGLAVNFLSMFVVFRILDRGGNPITAARDAVLLVWQNFVVALLIILLTYLLVTVGAAACAIGFLVTYPVTKLMAAYAYVRITDHRDQQRQLPAVTGPPPPPALPPA